VLTLERGRLRERTFSREMPALVREVPFLPLG